MPLRSEPGTAVAAEDGVPDGKQPVALVTGAGRRVGRALAIGLAESGYAIAVHYHSSGAEAAETGRLVAGAGVAAALVAADLRQPDAAAVLVQGVMDRFGRLDVVVNSASVMEALPVGKVTAAAWDSVLNLNLRAPFLIAQEAARHLCDGGVIINIADLSAFETWRRFVPHGVSKAGLVYLTRALAVTLAPRIRVNCVAPGTVLLPERVDEATSERWIRQTPLGRHGTPADVLQAVRYLIDASWVTGETLVVDGGWAAR